MFGGYICKMKIVKNYLESWGTEQIMLQIANNATTSLRKIVWKDYASWLQYKVHFFIFFDDAITFSFQNLLKFWESQWKNQENFNDT